MLDDTIAVAIIYVNVFWCSTVKTGVGKLAFQI